MRDGLVRHRVYIVPRFRTVIPRNPQDDLGQFSLRGLFHQVRRTQDLARPIVSREHRSDLIGIECPGFEPKVTRHKTFPHGQVTRWGAAVQVANRSGIGAAIDGGTG
jgi:hypothetical protein